MLWLPSNSHPKVKPEAGEAVVLRIAEHGEHEVIRDGLRRLELHQEPMADYLEQLGFQLNRLSTEGPWPAQSLRFGAAVAYLSYLESGYFQEVDDGVLGLALEMARMDGIPDSFTSSYYSDGALGHTLEAVHTECKIPPGEGQDQISSIGAGVVRYFMQHAVAA